MPDKRARDELVAEIAKRQHGAISTRQLSEAGLSRDAVLERRRSGRLHRLHRGVYAVGHVAPSAERGWMAAVLALGEGAVLSHQSAAALWALLPNETVPWTSPCPTGEEGNGVRAYVSIDRPGSMRPSWPASAAFRSHRPPAPSATSARRFQPWCCAAPSGKPMSSAFRAGKKSGRIAPAASSSACSCFSAAGTGSQPRR